MENNEIMNNNEEVIETTTEEIVKAASNGGMKKATTIGLAMIAGALTYKFVVVPAAAKFKNWRENRKTVVTQPIAISSTKSLRISMKRRRGF